jgi:hypothetical protein
MATLNPHDESHRLREESQRVRGEALRTRIMAAHTFCEVAERQARWESIDAAHLTLSKAWHSIEELERHIREPNHVSEEVRTELVGLLWKLEQRASKLEGELSKNH